MEKYPHTEHDNPAENPEDNINEAEEKLATGEYFLKIASEIPEETELDVGARQKILSSFLKLPQFPNYYGYEKKRYESSVTAYGLEAPFVNNQQDRPRFTIFPFNDEALNKIHRKTMARIETRAANTTTEPNYWKAQHEYWGKPFQESVSNLLYAEMEKRIVDETNREARAEGLQLEDITQEEREFYRSFGEIEKKAVERIAQELFAPIYESYGDYEELREETIKNLEETVKLHNELNPENRLTEQLIGFLRKPIKAQKPYIEHIKLQKDDLVRSNKKWIEQKKKLEQMTKEGIVSDSMLRSLLFLPPPLYFDLHSQELLNNLKRSILKAQLKEYEANSIFPFKRKVVSNLASSSQVEEDLIGLLKKHAEEFAGTETVSESAIQCLEEYRALLKQYSDIRIKITERNLSSKIINKRLQARKKQLESQRSSIEKIAAKKCEDIKRNISIQLGLSPQSITETTQIIIFPTGITIVDRDRPTLIAPISPLDQKMVNLIPKKFKDAWVGSWRRPQNDDEYKSFQKSVRAAINELIEEELENYGDSTKSIYSFLNKIQKQYSVRTEKLINTLSGRLNPQLSAKDAAVVAKVASPFLYYISVLKKAPFDDRITAKQIKSQTQDYLSGKSSNIPKTLFSNGSLNVGILTKIAEEDKTNGKATINLLSTNIGISLYSSLTTTLRNKFGKLVSKQSNVSAASFFKSFGNMVNDSVLRRELMEQVLFVSYFSQHIVGKAPKFFESFMSELYE